ncbi:MAG: sigma-70 family RNA polymerase sigma factor [Lachnospiraceae bacterium]|nr:sigma-70 family RNA polymerase sigma factor [Lachnospiraceae bacterium]
MQEQNIIEKLKMRDEGGMEALQLHFGPLLRYVIRPLLSDERDREECLQDAFLRIWQEIVRYDPEKGEWKAWITTIARNLALNRQRGRGSETPGEIPRETAAPDPGPEEKLLQRERQEALLAALGQLKMKDRELFYRKYYYRQSTEQIAGELGTTLRAVEGRLYRIKSRLRDMLKGELYE